MTNFFYYLGEAVLALVVAIMIIVIVLAILGVHEIGPVRFPGLYQQP